MSNDVQGAEEFKEPSGPDQLKEQNPEPNFQPQNENEWGGFPKALIYIGIMVLVNILSYALDWGFWVY